mmetsp:Transcript_31170/g.47693  ORF Transcript_31170/g.47693 Transcript_31170/m.47693 type:complete len:81 (-) Transcript_31170:876-1118(-)
MALKSALANMEMDMKKEKNRRIKLNSHLLEVESKLEQLKAKSLKQLSDPKKVKKPKKPKKKKSLASFELSESDNNSLITD